MTDDTIKTAERRGYSKGYLAGRKKKRTEQVIENMRRERQSFLDKAFISLLSGSMLADGWKSGDKPIVGIAERVGLARKFAIEALKQRPIA